MNANERIISALEKSGRAVKPISPTKSSALCPAHEDRSPSLNVTAIEGSVLIHCFAGCQTVDVLATLGLTMADLYDDRRGAEYRYDNGRIVTRTPDKKFRQANTGQQPELYRLAKVRAAVAEGLPVFVAEGEKDVHALEAFGVTATCSPMGAGKWGKIDPSPLYGSDVSIIADQDEPGRKHAEDVYRSLAPHGEVAIFAPQVGKDAADHIAAGYGVEDLVMQPLPSGAVEIDQRRRPLLGEDALHGLPGRVVRAVAPHTEADPAALLVTFLAAAGGMLGKDGHMLAGDAEHPPRMWPLIIGKTAGGMKGTSWKVIRRVILAADPGFSTNIVGGLSSGEGLIEAVRDGHGEPDDEKDFDEGVTDKRLLIVESEFAAVLGKARREGNVLSETLRQAWDGGRLSTMTRKSSKLVATDPHVTIISHITPGELRAKLSDSDVNGGLMNRFLPVLSHRSKRLPDGGSTPIETVNALGVELSAAIERAKAIDVRELSRDAEAAALWRQHYDSLTPDTVEDGHFASVVARAVPQVVRLSVAYALLDTHPGQVAIRAEHLRAALAVWAYVESSAHYVLGELGENRNVAKITDALDRAGDAGLTRSQIRDLFGNHKSAPALDELLRQIVGTGRYVESTLGTGGRPAKRYHARVHIAQ